MANHVPGDVEAAVLRDVAKIGTERPGQIALAQVAIKLARTLDELGDHKTANATANALRLVINDYRFSLTAADAEVAAKDLQPVVLDSIDELKKRRRTREAGTSA